LYEDYFLFRVISVLKQLRNTAALLIYVSDHGESLGEYGIYLHGIPDAIAPDVQKDIPFVIWMSEEFIYRKGVQAGWLESQRIHKSAGHISQRDGRVLHAK